MQVRLNAAEERASRLEWEHQDAATKAMRQLAEARSEVEEWRREAAALEVERDRLLHQHPGRPQHTLSTGSYASTPRRGRRSALPANRLLCMGVETVGMQLGAAAYRAWWI